MRILFINEVLGTTSTGKIVAQLAEEYESNGYVVKVAYGRWGEVPKKYQKYAVRIGTDWDVKCHALQTRILDNHGFGSKRATRHFINWIETYQPDIIWLHNLHGYYINVELLFEWLKKNPKIEKKWTLHDCWPITGHCSHFTYVGCNKWKYQCHICSQKYEYPKSVLVDNSKRNYSRKKECFSNVYNMTVITPSKWLEGIVRQSYLKNYEIRTINNKIDLSMFKPTPGNFKEKYNIEKKIVLGVASIWNERKGLKDYYRLADALGEQFKVVLVGLSEKQLGKLPANILGIAKTNCVEELVEIYSAASVFVNLTYEDTYPTVNLEAQACGTPCITYNTGGSSECVPKVNVVDCGNVEKIAYMVSHEQYARKE